MKIRRSIVLLCALAILLTFLIVWRTRSPQSLVREPANQTNVTPSQSATNASPNSGAETTARKPQRNQQGRTNAPANVSSPVSDDPRIGLSALNDVPIIFDGKLEDQFGNAVAGATIDASVRIYNGFKSGVERFIVISDDNGLFHIDHGKGEALGVVPRKDGYALATANAYFKYSHMYPDRYVPDSRTRTVIKMWKLQGPEPLTSIDKEYRLLLPQRPLFFDFVTGEISETSGDLEITIVRAPGSLSKKAPGDWSIELKPVSGGIIESDYHGARVAFAAPADGYQKNYIVQMSRGDPAWFDNFQKVFFIECRSGRIYAKVNLDFGINREPTDPVWLHISAVANANGSRNWEASMPQ